MYKDIVESHITTRKAKIRSKSTPWMNSTIRKELNGRYKLLMKAQKTPNGSVEWSNYRKARNRCTNLFIENC